MLNYTVIAYKPNGYDNCDSWDSDFEKESTKDHNVAIKLLSEFYYKNKVLTHNEPEWEFELLINGYSQSESNKPSLYNTIYNRAENIAKIKYENQLKEKENKRLKEIENARQQQIQRDLKTLKRLKDQYGDII